MVDEREPQSVGTTGSPSGLGPQAVGVRVVVRRILPGETGPSGGPAMTDLLGTCTAWGDGVCEVTPEGGPPVRIPLEHIVSGKPVPPRPSVRHRVSAAAAESRVASLWARLEQEPLGAWTLRSDPAPVGRLRRRANSCLAMGDPSIDVAEASAAIQEFYAARSRPVMAHVETESAIEAELLDLGWEPLGGGTAHFQLASIAQLRRGLRSLEPPASIKLTETRPDQALVTIEDQAQGMATYADDWIGLHDLLVSEAYRRRGLARVVIAELLAWGLEQGATTAWLHVETNNAPGLALYEALGFRTHHTARYLRPSNPGG